MQYSNFEDLVSSLAVTKVFFFVARETLTMTTISKEVSIKTMVFIDKRTGILYYYPVAKTPYRRPQTSILSTSVKFSEKLRKQWMLW